MLSGRDLISVVVLNGSTSFNFSRFCSADLPAVSAYYNAATGMGTTARIFMNGEEVAGGRAFGHVVTGGDAFISYELPLLGRFAHENIVANPFAQDKTVVAGLDDTTPQAPGLPTNSGGRIYMYIGTKTASGTPVDRAGLTNGTNYAIQVAGVNLESRDFGLAAAGPGLTTAGTFTLVASGGTQFLRPEDGAWDPNHPRDFYYVTTDRLDTVQDGIGTQIGRSRLWRLRFNDVTNPLLGGTIKMVLDGTEGGNMYDNITVDRHGRIILLEDVGNAAHNGKVWMYEIASGHLVQVAKHDPARFGDVGVPPTAPFTQDEETSGVIDVSDILGDGTYLLDDQAHYPINNANPNGFSNPNELVEGGQLMLLHVPVPPTVDTVEISDDSDHKSHDENVVVTLNGIVAADGIAPGAFTLTRGKGGAFAVPVQSVASADGQTEVVLRISKHDLGGGSLKHYTLTIEGSKIRDGLGQATDADGDGYAGGVRTVALGDLDDDGNREPGN